MISGSGALGTGPVSDFANLTFSVTSPLTYGGAISGIGNLTQSGTGAGGILTLTGSSTYSGATTIGLGSTLVVGTGGLGASIGNTNGVINVGSLVFNHADSQTFAPAIVGNGSLTQTGSGLLALLGATPTPAARSFPAARSRWATAAAARRSPAGPSA